MKENGKKWITELNWWLSLRSCLTAKNLRTRWRPAAAFCTSLRATALWNCNKSIKSHRDASNFDVKWNAEGKKIPKKQSLWVEMVPQLKQGRSHGESQGANFACDFLLNERFARAACHCFNSGAVSNQALSFVRYFERFLFLAQLQTPRMKRDELDGFVGGQHHVILPSSHRVRAAVLEPFEMLQQALVELDLIRQRSELNELNSRKKCSKLSRREIIGDFSSVQGGFVEKKARHVCEKSST